MERYINPSKIDFKTHLLAGGDGEVYIALSDVRKAIAQTPSEDVAPRSEVERLNKEFDELAEEHSDLIVEKDQLFDIAEKQMVEIQALKIANEKMYGAIEATIAEVVKEIISIIEQRIELNDEHACGVHSEILSALYRGKKDAYRDITEILKQKYGGSNE